MIKMLCLLAVASVLLNACGGDASDTKSPVAKVPASNPSVLHEQHSLKLMNGSQYHSALQALFVRPLPKEYSRLNKTTTDKTIIPLPQQEQEAAIESRLKQYEANAEALAKWATSTPAVLRFHCANNNTKGCANVFIDQFASLAFRRPLSQEERMRYSGMITQNSSGLERAIATVLRSPDFLWRS